MSLDLSCLGLEPADLSALQSRLLVPALPSLPLPRRLIVPSLPLPGRLIVPNSARAGAFVQQHHCGPMDVVCLFCSARFFRSESMCCCTHGAVALPPWRVPPEPLLTFLGDVEFRHKIRGYNCTFSLGSSVFEDLTARVGPATFKMAGRSWHLLPHSVCPGPLHGPKTAQIYALPMCDAADRRLELTSGKGRTPLRRQYLEALHVMLLQCNALVRSFVQCATNGSNWHIGIGSLEPHATAANDTMVGLLVNGGGERCSVVLPQDGTGSLVIVPDLDPYYQPLHFVLLFPYGDPQWGTHLDRAITNGRKRGRACAAVSLFDYLRFHVQRRVPPADCSIHSFGRLFEEWVVDCYLQNENQVLRYLKSIQSQFRREQFSRVQQQLHAGAPARLIGSPATHLPSSFARGSRHFRELYADAMTLPAHYGGIDYFVTFTTNPSWPEIVEHASDGVGMNAPDLYCRVFHLKMKALLCDVLENGVLGVVVAYTYSIEFQQRGLPHMHAIFIVRPADKPHTAAIIDGVVSAQLPDPVVDPVYFTAVTQHMLHGPCGVHKPSHYCMRHGVCRFDFPKRLSEQTTIPADGYANVARPIGPKYKTESFTYDNGWVVPHNRFLLLKYNAHINVECSASIAVVRYMFSYIYKGSKATTTSVSDSNNEIQQFSDGRITSAADALWHVLKFPSHGQSPKVLRLSSSLPSDPSVQFDPNADPDEIELAMESQVARPNQITAWFALNAVDDFARTLLYVDIPTHYVWLDTEHKWQRRQNRSNVLGRIYPVDPSSRERWALRVLLLHSRGCTSEASIRTIHDELRPTFLTAAMAAGLLDDDKEYERCLASHLCGSALRSLLLIIIRHCSPNDPMALIAGAFDMLTDDFVGSAGEKNVQLFRFIASQVDVPVTTLGLEPPPDLVNEHCVERLFLESFVSATIIQTGNLNVHQQLAQTAIIGSTLAVSGTIFALLAPAGTGKTFLINSILSTAHQLGLRVVPCATSGLAASLLGHARTAHGTFKIPVEVDEVCTCRTSAAYKEWMRSIQCWIWDEISMAHRWAIDAVDRLLRDVRDCEKPFGGATVVFCGDMQQLLPVHRFAKDPAVYCIKMCSWWSDVVPLQLVYNERARADPQWAELVAGIGEGRPAVFPVACVVPNVQALIAAVWPAGDYLAPGQRSILTMTRSDANDINLSIAALCPGAVDCALSYDSALDCDQSLYPIEFINTVSFSGVPEHTVNLLKGAPYLITQNTSPILCNGTRVIYHRRVGKCLEVQICAGVHSGEFHYIPRLVMTVTNPTIPFTLRRVQYPLMYCWAMTVHKSQGQTLDRVGIYFERPTWAHGLLYVAVSRVRRSSDCFWVGQPGELVHNFCSQHVLQSTSAVGARCASRT